MKKPKPYRNFVVLILWISLSALVLSCGKKSGKESEAEKSSAQQENTANAGRSREILSHRTLGLAYLEENKLPEAEGEFKKLIELSPDEALGYANLGIVYMRMGEYKKAEEQLKKAVELNPDDPDIRLNLAKVYQLTNQEEASRSEMEKSIEIAPDHVQTLYSLAESYQKEASQSSLKQWEKYMARIVETAPNNIVARLYLVEALVRNGKTDEALAHMEEIGKQSPAFPDEADSYYQKSIQNLQSGNAKDALTNVRIFHNLLKLTNFYQTDIQELKGNNASLIGTPVITLSEPTTTFLSPGESILEAMQFTDVTASAGLNLVPDTLTSTMENLDLTTHITVGDMERDGDQDIYLSTYDPAADKFTHFLLRNNFGRFEDAATKTGIRHEGKETSADFIDYDNDGFLDLYVTRPGKNILYKNISENVFGDETAKAHLGDSGTGHDALFFDMDQDGDLDLFLSNENSVKMYRNNGDGTFLDVTAQAGTDHIRGAREAVFGDFDEDGVLDLLIILENGKLDLLSNVRQGKFIDKTSGSGLDRLSGVMAVSVGDYNNDGSSDILITTREGSGCGLFKNDGKGMFSVDKDAQIDFGELKDFTGLDGQFFDFDNDGHLDIMFAGQSVTPGGRGVFLFHNNGDGTYKDTSYMLPGTIRSGRQIVLADYNEDGDLDIYLAGLHSGMHLLRNDGGNANHHLKVQLVGLRTGSGKNNYFGIGAKVEVRAGDLYQMKTVTGPNVHFGLGNRDKVDIVRIVWTNGVPQNIFSPGSDQDLIEQQELKGSCPFLYTWNGQKYTFLKDIMWRSALGMPMGIMGGERTYAFPDASEEYIKIPGIDMKPLNGNYVIQVTSELWETIYFDKIRLIAVDHPSDIDIYVDEKFLPPPYPANRIFQVKKKLYPVSVTDGKGNDLLPFIAKKDNRYVANMIYGKYQGITNMRDLVLDLGNINEADSVYLFLSGWIFPTDASINVAISQSGEITPHPPSLLIKNSNGEWKTMIENMSFPMGKDKTMVEVIPGCWLKYDHHITIRTNLEIYWDEIFYTTSLDNREIKTIQMKPASADLHYRGFSALYRKGGRYGPHWFDYYTVSGQPKWRDLEGYYTRYGDVNELLDKPDNQYIIMNAGDEVTISFVNGSSDGLPPGWVRDFLIYSVGWVKDGDLNTAYGNKVEPLPYHGMSSYPYKSGQYPVNNDLREYQRIYNTRKVTDERFREEIRAGNE